MNLIPHLIALIGLILAVTIGVFIAEGKNYALLGGFSLGLLLIFAKWVGAFWILLGLIYASIGLDIQPIGPRLEPAHVVLAMAWVFIVANFWKRKSGIKESAVTKKFKPFLWCFGCLFAYTIGVSFFHTFFPHSFMGDALRNLIKQQFSICGGFLIIATSLIFKNRFLVGKFPIKNILILVGLGLVFNIALRLYGIFVLRIGEVNLLTGMEVPHSTFFIPGINATDNVFILRFLSPMVACLSACILSTHCVSNKTPFIKFLALSNLCFGVFGSIISQGRVSVLLCIGMVGIVLLVRKRIVLLLAMGFMSVLLLFGVKMAFEYDARILPIAVQRSFGWLPFLGSTDARASIDSSTNWRYKTFDSAISEIATSNRILLFGRGVYGFSDRDIAIINQGGFDGAIEVNRRRAATHNLITDIILTSGAIGLLLYLVTYCAMLYGLYCCWAGSDSPAAIKDLALAAFVMTFFGLFYSFIAGGFIQTIEALLISAIFVVDRQNQSNTGQT